MFVHILAFEIPKAMRGVEGYTLNVFAYSLVLLSYLFAGYCVMSIGREQI